MPKLFVVSDIHSFLEPLKNALDKEGFDPKNKDHWLIICGDAFDRGPDSCELYDFIMSLERKVLVKGNHDILMQDMIARGYCCSHDAHNGTQKTFWQFLNKEAVSDTKDPYVAVSEFLQPFWEQQVNYFETENHIFVHSWIPVNQKGFGKYTFREDWRDATNSEWEDAMWGNPFDRAQSGLNETDKTIVFGHWHCSAGHSIDNRAKLSEFGPDACWDIYKNESQGIIGIDRCTAHTGEVNVLVLEDNFLENLE